MKDIKINEKHLGFQIFHHIFFISHFIKKRARLMLKNLDISEAEARILFLIGLNKNSMNIHDLIEYSKIHKSTVRQKIKPLISKKILNIIICDYDKRERKVELTKKGKFLFKKILEINKKYHSEVFKDFNQNEIEQLLLLLTKLELTYK